MWMPGKINNLTSKMVDFSAKDTTAVKNNIVDVLYKMPSDGWNFLQDKFGSLTDLIQTTHDQVEPMVTFLGLNIADSPLSTIKSSFASHSWLMLIGALLIPIISYVTQVINIKMMPQPQQTQTGDSSTDAMAAQMKTMNIYAVVLICYVFYGSCRSWYLLDFSRSISCSTAVLHQ